MSINAGLNDFVIGSLTDNPAKASASALSPSRNLENSINILCYSLSLYFNRSIVRLLSESICVRNKLGRKILVSLYVLPSLYADSTLSIG
jgi:hypothetical protein